MKYLLATIVILLALTLSCGPNPYLPYGYHEISLNGRPAYCWSGDRDRVFEKARRAYPPYELVYSEVDYDWAYVCVQRPRRY